ncbi:uncharacterized protein LOC128843494 isoform X2 [Malaclemys terrapin pileata]|uniref:uncharacterized protein LOC128843494 isoform X2 n=1 Tax=Malaclemys terrapin pileata TaxID=2991368 RepID=UPI0023A7A6E8|nr:uncharacterized protein LOC128843494 isoform X2 [Malaclemys terrapin pileata]
MGNGNSPCLPDSNPVIPTEQRCELISTDDHAELISRGDHEVPESQKSSSMDRTGAAYVSPSQRLAKIRRQKKTRTRDEMFSELMLSSHTDRAQQNAWRQTMSECRKAQYERKESAGLKRVSGRLKMIGGISLLTEGRSQCSDCWRFKLRCSSVWLSCRKGSRSTDRCYSSCVTNSPPPQVP